MSEQLTFTTIETPVGTLTLVASEVGLRAVLWPDDDPARVRLGERTEDATDPVLAAAAVQLDEYFRGERLEFDLPLDPVGTDFQRATWDALRQIPFGTTISYGEQAARMGSRGKARAVGAANGRNPLSIVVPCHRVVASTGSLTGFAGGIETKRWLLAHEQRLAGDQATGTA